MSWTRSALAALAAAVLLSGCATGPGSDPPSGQCLDTALQSALGSATRVEVLAATSAGVPRALRRTYQHMFADVAACVRPGTWLTLAPVDEQSAAASPLFAQQAPPDGPNPLVNGQRKADFTSGAAAAMQSLWSLAPTGDGLGITEALVPAAERLQGTPAGQAAVVVLTSGWQSSGLAILANYNVAPSAAVATQVLSRMRAEGIWPALPAGTAVYLAGVDGTEIGGSSTPHWEVNTPQLLGLEGFWSAVFAALGGRLSWCAPLLPGETESAAAAVPLSQSASSAR